MQKELEKFILRTFFIICDKKCMQKSQKVPW